MEIVKRSRSSSITHAEVPEEQSLRHIIRTRFPNGMPEDFIAIIMGDILQALSFIHVFLRRGHNDVSSRNICFTTEQTRFRTTLVIDPQKNYVFVGRAWREGGTPIGELWDLGTTALEMGYGSLPTICIWNENLVSLANNVIRILRLKLKYPDEKGTETAKNKGKEKLVIADDQEVKDKAMQKGKEKLKIVDDPKGKEKAMLKGKEKLEPADDLQGKEMAKQKGKEKSEIADDQKGKEMAKKKGKEAEKLTITLPALEKLMNICYVEHLEKKLLKEKEDQGKKKFMVALREKFKKAMKFFGKNDNNDERKFSRDFLEVVLMCLEVQLTTFEQIRAHPFFQQPIDEQKFERSLR